MKIKHIMLALAVSFSTLPAFGQEKVESEVVMTKSELKSFLQTVADAKRKALAKEKKESAKNGTTDLDWQIKVLENRLNRAKQQRMQGQHLSPNADVSNAELLREVQRLNDRLYYIEMGQGGTRPQSGTTTVLNPGSQSNAPIASNLTPSQQQEFLEAKAKLDSLQRLAAQNSNAQTQSAYEAELARINSQLDGLQAALNAQPTTETSMDQLKAKYKNFKRTVYFAHDSEAISNDDFAAIQAVANVLNDNERLNVVVKGFASKVGNPVYNNDLSMRRTESVKKALVAQGVSVDQIITIFHGEDFTTNDADARRVDMKIQVMR